ncbi:MAG TPA: hypothetical protein VHO03_17135 [Ignavibacteriales bacterium]|nr:hypothetical protein [Ignavibacteriales bacterium]
MESKEELKAVLREILPEYLNEDMLAKALKKVFTPNRVKAMTRGSMTIKQAAIYKGVGEKKIREKIASKELEISREKGGVKIQKSALDQLDFRKSGTLKTKPEPPHMSARDRFQQKILDQHKLKNK